MKFKIFNFGDHNELRNFYEFWYESSRGQNGNMIKSNRNVHEGIVLNKGQFARDNEKKGDYEYRSSCW